MKKQNPYEIYSVSALNLESKALLYQHFGTIFVAGEISNLSRPTSGHLYFSLKDEKSQVRCALFRFQHQQTTFALENGQAVIVQAEVSLYEARGDFQLIITHVELAGEGKLRLAFEQLKKTLAEKGLFDDTYKKPLPALPKQIGIITSPSAAALHDILKVLKKRFAAIPVLIYPTLVQGEQAATQIAYAIQRANQHKTCDVLILARGGGSLEDLWPFNEEKVAYAIFESQIPIVTGIGHQTDFTIADFVADVRAPTPSAAAEYVVPDANEWQQQLLQQQNRLYQSIRSKIDKLTMHLSHLQKRLKHPAEKLRDYAQQLDTLEISLIKTMHRSFLNYRQILAHCMHILENLSPSKILQRGFSITRKKNSNQIITQINQLSSGEMILTQLQEGVIESMVSS